MAWNKMPQHNFLIFIFIFDFTNANENGEWHEL
jgi:hypothetical protein